MQLCSFFWRMVSLWNKCLCSLSRKKKDRKSFSILYFILIHLLTSHVKLLHSIYACETANTKCSFTIFVISTGSQVHWNSLCKPHAHCGAVCVCVCVLQQGHKFIFTWNARTIYSSCFTWGFYFVLFFPHFKALNLFNDSSLHIIEYNDEEEKECYGYLVERFFHHVAMRYGI